MQWFSAISEKSVTADAIEEVSAELRAALGEDVDLVLLFASTDHARELPPAAIKSKALIGCSGRGIIGGGKEIEDRRALSLTAAKLDGVELTTLHLRDDIPQDDGAWYERLGFDAGAEPSFILLPDPFSFNVEACLRGLDSAFPGATIVGGLASGATMPGGHTLFIDGSSENDGAVLLALTGDIVIDPIIAQGCRPVGSPMLVSSCDGHVILSLDGKPPGETLRALHDSLPVSDRNLMQRSLFMGVEMKDQVEYKAGDFLIRNIVGLDPDGKALAIAAKLQQWQAVQFHLRDRAASADDLDARLTGYVDGKPSTPPGAAVLFSCLGRGEHLYDVAGHDSDMFRGKVGDLALGGFFCNGEIGPVGGTTFVHGYTSAFGVFRRRA